MLLFGLVGWQRLLSDRRDFTALLQSVLAIRSRSRCGLVLGSEVEKKF